MLSVKLAGFHHPSSRTQGRSHRWWNNPPNSKYVNNATIIDVDLKYHPEKKIKVNLSQVNKEMMKHMTLTSVWNNDDGRRLLIRTVTQIVIVSSRAGEKAERSQNENTSWVANNQTLFSQINKNKIHNNNQNNISYLGA